MPRHPGEYAVMLTQRLAAQGATVWLVNTGWTGGPYGTGERMNISHTRAMVRAALDGTLATAETRIDPIFRVEVPLTCPDVPASFLDPRSTWADPDAYDRQAAALAAMFALNFADYADGVEEDIRAAGPVVTDPNAAAGFASERGAG
jgi:phosphoenolpyruvate carboxykinase (ATP)